jgi:predicted ATPase/DNA-binding SARP family transcriptional activator
VGRRSITTEGAGSGSTDGLSIGLLGPPAITVGDEPLRVDTRKAVAVLAMVAVDGPTARTTLAARLWPDSHETRARGALRRTLSVLGSGLGGRWLTVTPTSVSLDGAGAWVDTDEIAEQRRSIAEHEHAPSGCCSDCLPPLRRIARLHRGAFMDGFVLRGSAEFSDWQHGHAERLRRELHGTLDRLTRLEAEAGDLDAALATAGRWLELDVLNEQAHARLMLLHGRRGERAEAIRRYRECAAVLDRELGVAPLARTTALYEAIVEGRLDGQASAPRPSRERAPVPPASTGAVSKELPFVGRDGMLDDALRQLTAAGGRLLVVRGEAGIGKTRFVDELESRLHQRSLPVLGVHCQPGEQRLALAPFVALLRSAIARPGALERVTALPPDVRGEAGRLLPVVADAPEVPPPAPLDAPGSHARFLDAVLTTLVTAAAPPGTRPVVVIEDLHAADDATLDLLSYAIRRLLDHPVGLVLTWRSEDLPSTPAAKELERAVRTPGEAADDAVVELERLTSEATAELCRAALGSASDDLFDRVAAEAEGLPLAVVEYLRWLLALGESPSADWPIPSGVRALVGSRLDGLSETALQLTTAAAVLGHSVDLRLLAGVAGRSAEETADGADELLTRGILRPATSGTYDFSHEKIRTVAYERATPARRRLLHARAAEALAERAHRRGPGQLAAVIADHARLGGDEEAAAAWSVRAGDHAAAVFANAEARAHYERALALDHPDPTTVHRRLGRLKLLDGEYAGARESYETAAALAPDPCTLAEVEHELGALHLRRGQLDAARAHLESALQLSAGTRPDTAARVTTDLGLTELQAGALEMARQHATAALALAEEGGDRQARAQARNLMGLLARRLDQTAQAQRHLEHAAALASTLADPSAYIAALNNLALSTADVGDLDRAVELLGTALQRCERQGDRHRAAALHNNLADLHHRDGDEERAMDHLKRAVSLFADVAGPATRDPEIWKLVEW